MSGNKSKPSKTGDEKVKAPAEEVETKEVKETKNDFSSKVAKFMNKSSSKKKARSVDPIIAVSATVLIICCAVVIGYTIYDKCFADHTEPNVEYGDTVNVEYVGSYYIYYDEDGSAIFDTNIKSVGTSTDYTFAHEWKSKDTYDVYKVTVGSGGSLPMFEDALIGHHPGETVRVCVPAGEGYELKGGYHTGQKTGNITSLTRVFDNADAFKSFFGEDALTDGPHTIQSPYGWNAQYAVDKISGKVTVEYLLTESDKDKEFSKEGSDVKYKVDSVDSATGEVEYDLIFDWNSESPKMLLTFDEDGNTIYITDYSSETPDKYQYKIKTGDTSDDDREISGATLYFVIKIIEYAE